MDNHQLELYNELKRDGYIFGIDSVKELIPQVVGEVNFTSIKGIIFKLNQYE